MNPFTRCGVSVLLTFRLVVLLTGCAASGGGVGFADKALDVVGLQAKPAAPDPSSLGMPNMPDLRRSANKVTLRLHAGDLLNTGESGQSLSLVVRLYHLKEAESFLRLPYERLGETTSANDPAWTEGVVDVREIVLTPGQKYEAIETLSGDVTYLGVVGLFRAPDERRWRFVFDAKEAAKSGITLGAHGCAFSVSAGQPVNAPVETLRLAGVRCQ